MHCCAINRIMWSRGHHRHCSSISNSKTNLLRFKVDRFQIQMHHIQSKTETTLFVYFDVSLPPSRRVSQLKEFYIASLSPIAIASINKNKNTEIESKLTEYSEAPHKKRLFLNF